VYRTLSAQHLASLPLRTRLHFYQGAVERLGFPDLRSVVKDMSRRLAAERLQQWRRMPADLKLRQRQRDTKRWRLTAAKVPPGPCTYCWAPNALTVDHILPCDQGGDRWDLANLTRACRRCNSQKSNRTPEQWRAWCLASGRPWPPVWVRRAA
jgi:5-methylcytosine-specific restriction endonuclease McrA